MQVTSTTIASALLTSAGLVAGASAQAPSVSNYGAACGTAPTIAAQNQPLAGTDFNLQLAASNPSLLILVTGFSNTTWLSQPLPLDLSPFGFPGGCSLLTALDLSSNHLPDFITGSVDVTVPLPGNSGGVNAYFQVLEYDLLFGAFTGVSAGTAITIGAPGPVIDGLSTTSGGNGTLLTISGSDFNTPAKDNCIRVGGQALAIAQNGSDTSLTVQLEGSLAGSGPVEVVRGLRDELPASAFVALPGTPAVPGLSVFTGDVSDQTVAVSSQTFTVAADPKFKSFQVQPSEGTGLTYEFEFDPCQAGDCLRVFMIISENGRTHDVYFTDGTGSFLGKTLDILSDMSPQICALWACSWIQTSLEPRIPGFQCDIQGGKIVLSVSEGTGITNITGGFWVSSDC